MKRLLTVGCSYTFYKWKTWADYLGQDFTNFVNKGIPGADNSTIARIIVSMAEPGDLVVVMWSSYLRHNYKIDYNSTYNWSKYHWGESNIHDKYYFTYVFNQYERFLTSLDYIELAHLDSKNRGYRIIHLSAFPFMHGELNAPVTQDMQSKAAEKQYIINLIHQPDLWTFNKPYYKPYKKYLGDDHPIEAVHELYCTTVVRPLLPMSNNEGQ